MIVVSDTSPLNYLVLIDLQHILPELFERILIPAAVREELQSAGAPEAIARFMRSWLRACDHARDSPVLVPIRLPCHFRHHNRQVNHVDTAPLPGLVE